MRMHLLDTYRIILASNSPRRKALLEEVGIRCSVCRGLDVSESFPEGLTGEEISLYLARKKSEAFPDELEKKDILITADTVVWQDGKVLHKPEDADDARRILKMLSDSSHFVYTGVYLRSGVRSKGFTASTQVWFGKLSDKEIDYYIQRCKPFDKAGAYGIQEWIGLVGVDRIDGSFYNVMGLPVHRLYRELESFIK
jgi:septum formation protein